MKNLILLAQSSGFVDPVGDGKTFADSWARFSGLGIQTFLLGVLTVFSVLAILWGCLEAFRYFFYTLPEQKKNEERNNGQSDVSAVKPTVSVPKPTPKTAPKTAPVVQPAPVAPAAADDGAVVAAIIAAITAMRNEEAADGLAPGAFRVVSFRRKR